ncbi:MAG: DUF4139 domain-containing protein [Treponema sp.]|jgi:hypothetical protein|nr:DUF4139 domain-containing protein [Treponema sp.]
MKNKFFILILLILVMTGAGGQAQFEQDGQNDEIIVYRLPDPQRIYIYRNGTVVYDASIPANAIINNAFILPENVRLDSLIISQAGRRVYTYTTFTAEVLVVLRRGEMPRQVRVLQIYVPELKAGSSLEVKYGIRNAGLSWNLLLDLEASDNNTLDCALIAELKTGGDLPETTRSILAQKPEIILASASNALLEDSAAFFNLGKLVIEPNKRQLIRLEEGSTKYKIVYYWDANRRQRPSAYLRAQTPLKSMAGEVQYYLNSGGIIYDNDSVMVSPDRPFDILVGEQPNIVTYKSIVTAEFPERANTPFTHNLEYQIENQGTRTIEVEIAVPLAIGDKHRTEYRFTTKAPDERPGDRMLWKYTIAPGQKVVLQFSYDADLKYDPSYRQFDYSDGGR